MKDKQIIFADKNVVDFEEYEVREPKDNEALIAVKSQLLNAGTELANLTGITIVLQTGQSHYPIRPGGSTAGEILKVGKGITDLKVGDRVYGNGRHSAYNMCRRDDLALIPEGISYEEAPFAKLCSVSMQGVRVAEPQLGEVTVVLGAGIIGALAMQFVRIAGARKVIAVDLSENRLRMARELGIDATVNPSETDTVEAVKELTGGEMADIVIEATGNPKVFPTALKLARPRGRIVALGSPRGTVPELDLYTELHSKGLIMLGAHYVTHPRVETPYNRWTHERDMELALDLILQKRLPATQMVTHRFPIAEADKAYRMLLEDRTQALGVVFEG